jgi:hypothetical protein
MCAGLKSSQRSARTGYKWNTICNGINRAGISVLETKWQLSHTLRGTRHAAHISTLNKTHSASFAVLQILIECSQKSAHFVQIFVVNLQCI